MENLKVCEVTLTYNSNVKPSERKKISSSLESANIFKAIELFNNNLDYKELFYCMYLNRANKVLSVTKIAEGTTSACLVDIKMILQGAILQNASCIILCHNHPSGNLKPSAEDFNITKKVKECAKMFEVHLLDHIIITSEANYYSFADEGQI